MNENLKEKNKKTQKKTDTIDLRSKYFGQHLYIQKFPVFLLTSF